MFFVLCLVLSVFFTDRCHESQQTSSKTGILAGPGNSKDAIILIQPEIKSDLESTFPAGYKSGIIASFNISVITDSERNTSMYFASNRKKISEIIPVQGWKQFFLLAALRCGDEPILV